MEASPPQPPEPPRPPEPPQPPAGPDGQELYVSQPAGQWPQGPPPGSDPAQYGPYPYGPAQPGQYPYAPPQKRKGFPAWAIVLIVAAVLVPVTKQTEIGGNIGHVFQAFD